MKKIILVLAVLAVSIFSSLASERSVTRPVINLNDILNGYAQLPQVMTTPTNWTEDSFSPGDTTSTFDVNHASVVYVLYADSALTGTDTLWIGTQVTLDNGRILRAQVSVHNATTTTATTYVSFPIIPGNGLTALFSWNPTNVGGTKFTGTMFMARTNVNDNVTPFLPVGRFAWAYE
mgnify:CR=1 FL=1